MTMEKRLQTDLNVSNHCLLFTSTYEGFTISISMTNYVHIYVSAQAMTQHVSAKNQAKS